jgi:hypothetical protein
MKNKLYIGIDNGISGTIGCICNNQTWFFETPIKKEQNYTKAKANISRIDFNKLESKFIEILKESNCDNVICLIERPMVNPTRFKATTSALRALEATLNVVESLDLPYQYEDSKKWQRELLPKGSQKEQLKKDSLDIGCRLFPQHKELIIKHKDADGILMAEYAKRNNL